MGWHHLCKIFFGYYPRFFFSSLLGISGVSCVFLSTWCLPAYPSDSGLQANPLPATDLLYVSDYFSFVGQDDQGHVALALDNNRGRDGESWQAEHFVVLHDEQQGWVPLQGNGAYDNAGQELATIPASPAFHFQGTPRTGMTIMSDTNELTLSIEGISERLSQSYEGGQYWLGSATGILQWEDRTIKGRVIYEYFMMPEFNRLSRTYWGLWKHFQGLYLVVEGLGDLYVHSQESDMLAPLVGTLTGFLAVQGDTEPFQVLQATLLDHSQAWGLYRWPTGWGINWVSHQGSGNARLAVQDLKPMGNWIIGGFAMGIVKGTVYYNGKDYPVYGLAEIIM